MIRLALLAAAAVAAGCYFIGAHIPATDRRADLDALADEITELKARLAEHASAIDHAGREHVRRTQPLNYSAGSGADWAAW